MMYTNLCYPYNLFYIFAKYVHLLHQGTANLCTTYNRSFADNIYLFNDNNGNTGNRFELFKVNNKNTIMTSMTSFWCFCVNFKHISHLFLVFLLLTLNKLMVAGSCARSARVSLTHAMSMVSLRGIERHQWNETC